MTTFDALQEKSFWKNCVKKGENADNLLIGKKLIWTRLKFFFFAKELKIRLQALSAKHSMVFITLP